LGLEQLERRELLSASGLTGLFASPAAIYTPGQIQNAYHFSSLFSNYNANAGAGQTIAIVDAYANPNIVNDLITFDGQWGLPGQDANGVNGFLKVVDQNGGTNLPPADSGWGLEIALDVEWAHAIAPAAQIVLVEANSASYSDLLTAVDQAVTQGAAVVSMSWGGGEFSSEKNFDSHFNRTGVTFVASSGDNGAGAEYPAVSPYVVAVGGTSLTADASGNWLSETSWSGSGGGPSAYVSRPTYQSNYFNAGGLKTVSSAILSRGKRLTPDVSYDANPGTGVYVYDQGGWYQVGGTSTGAPQWAALIAIADQARVASGKMLLNSTTVLNTLYNPGSYAGEFHDIRSGSNGYSAGTGFDLVTGLGSPLANQVVAALSGAASGSVVKGGGGTTGAGQGGGGKGGSHATAIAPAWLDVTPLMATTSPLLVPSVAVGAPNGSGISTPITLTPSVPRASSAVAPETFAFRGSGRHVAGVDEKRLSNLTDSVASVSPSELATVVTAGPDDESSSLGLQDSDEGNVSPGEDA
jgi:subtilase family serine protease